MVGHHPNSLDQHFLRQLAKRGRRHASVCMLCHHVEEEYSDPNILPLLRKTERAEEQQQQQQQQLHELQELGYNFDREILSLDTN